MTRLESMHCSYWEPVSRDPSWKWIAEHVRLGSDSELQRFDFDLVPMERFFHRCVDDTTIRRITKVVCSQGGKTKNALAAITRRVKNAPRDTAWYTDTNEKAKTDYKVKIKPFFENCTAVAAEFPLDRSRKSQRLIQFESMNLHILGAESSGNRESHTLHEAWCDEVRKYPKGALPQIDNRLKTIRNSKRILFSSAADEHDDLTRDFNEGTRHMPFWICPHCQHRQVFRFGREETTLFPQKRDHGGFVWDTNDVTKPGEDVYNFAELEKTVRYECENAACRHHFRYEDRPQLMATLEMLPTNPHADPSHVSMWWWEAYMPWADCQWGRIVTKFLKAQLAARRGDFLPLRVFVTETLAEPWRPPGGHTIKEGEIIKRCDQYALTEAWDDAVNVITVDNQQGYLYYVHRAYKKNVGSRLIHTGTFPTFDELRAYQVAQKIRDRCVWIDCAYKPSDVFDACVKYGRWVADPDRKHAPFKGVAWDGWTPMAGEDEEDYTMRLNGDPVKTRWRFFDQEVRSGRSGYAGLIRKFLFSKPWFREQLFLYAVKGTLQWWLPKNIATLPEYLKQMSNVEHREVFDAQGQVTGHEWHEKGRHDFPDCEQMQLAVATIGELL